MLSSTVPAESQLLCAQCGYVVSGLPNDSRCPECGTLIAESDPSLRVLPEWERQPSLATLLGTTAAVLLRPSHFFHTFATKADRHRSRWFATIHLAIASTLFAIAAAEHLQYVEIRTGPWQPWLVSIVTVAAFCSLIGINWLVGRLTHWEATYRGLRLPIATVRRVMDYHTADYLPVAAVAALTVYVFTTLSDSGSLSARYVMDYFYVLCGLVIVSAGYLFHQYWVAMRNVMYANA